jgi:hypothetical protein
MDTFKEKQRLDDMYASGQSVWEVWKDSPAVESPALLSTAASRLKVANGRKRAAQ